MALTSPLPIQIHLAARSGGRTPQWKVAGVIVAGELKLENSVPLLFHILTDHRRACTPPLQRPEHRTTCAGARHSLPAPLLLRCNALLTRRGHPEAPRGKFFGLAATGSNLAAGVPPQAGPASALQLEQQNCRGGRDLIYLVNSEDSRVSGKVHVFGRTGCECHALAGRTPPPAAAPQSDVGLTRRVVPLGKPPSLP